MRNTLKNCETSMSSPNGKVVLGGFLPLDGNTGHQLTFGTFGNNLVACLLDHQLRDPDFKTIRRTHG